MGETQMRWLTSVCQRTHELLIVVAAQVKHCNEALVVLDNASPLLLAMQWSQCGMCFCSKRKKVSCARSEVSLLEQKTCVRVQPEYMSPYSLGKRVVLLNEETIRRQKRNSAVGVFRSVMLSSGTLVSFMC